MSIKTLVILALVLSLLVAGFFLVKPSRPAITAGTQGALAPGKKVFPDFKSDDVKAVVLAKAGQTLRLEKNAAGDWILATSKGRKAKADDVKDLLKCFAEAEIKDRRVGGAAAFGLDEASRLEVKALGADDKVLASVTAGKSPEWSRSFAQLAGQPDVLELTKDFGNSAQLKTETRKDEKTKSDKEEKVLSPEKWFDLKLIRFDRDDVIDVAITEGAVTRRIRKVVAGVGPVEPQLPGAPKADEKKAEGKPDERKAEDKKDGEKKAEEKKEPPKPVWRVTEPEDVEADEVNCNSLCSSASWLDAKGYADEVKPEEAGFDKPKAKVRFVLKNGTVHALTFGKVDDSGALMQVEGRPEVFRIEKYSFESLTQPLDKLKKAPPKVETKDEAKKDESKTEAKKDEPKAEEKK